MADNPGYHHDEDSSIPSCRNAGSKEDELTKKRHWSHYITLEPMLAFYYVSISTTQIAAQNLLLKKSCWPEAEPDAEMLCPDEGAAQLVVADINTWKPIVKYSIPIIFVLFAGSWSDNHGGLRKPLIILPLIGQIITDGLLLVNSICWSWNPIVSALCEALPASLGGGRPMLTTGVVSYLADITSHETRTFRLGIAMSFMYMGSPIGSMLSGILNIYLGFAGCFAICVAMNLLGLLTLLRVPETGRFKQANLANRCCDIREFTQALQTVCRPRQGYYRSCIIVLAMSIFSLLGPFIGEFAVIYLFVRLKFGWAEDDFGYFAAFKMIVVIVGTLLTMGILSRFFKLHDAVIGLLASICQTITYCTYPVVNVGSLMYAVALTEIMHGAALTVQKSIVTKFVSGDEMGQVNSIMSLTEALVPLVVFPVYNKLYQDTLKVFPGAFYLLSAALTVPSIFVFGAVYLLLRDKGEIKISDAKVHNNVVHQDEKYTKYP